MEVPMFDLVYVLVIVAVFALVGIAGWGIEKL